MTDCSGRLFTETLRIFRTVYAIAKMNIPFTTQDTMVLLQELFNGLNMGRVHRSDHSCANIMNHIAVEMKKRMCKALKMHNPHVAIMLDESTLFRTAVVVI